MAELWADLDREGARIREVVAEQRRRALESVPSLSGDDVQRVLEAWRSHAEDATHSMDSAFRFTHEIEQVVLR